MEGQIRRRIDGLIDVRQEVDLRTLITRIIIDLEKEGFEPELTVEWLRLRVEEIREDYSVMKCHKKGEEQKR